MRHISKLTWILFQFWQAWATADPEDIWNGFKPVCSIRHLVCSYSAANWQLKLGRASSSLHDNSAWRDVWRLMILGCHQCYWSLFQHWRCVAPLCSPSRWTTHWHNFDIGATVWSSPIIWWWSCFIFGSRLSAQDLKRNSNNYLP